MNSAIIGTALAVAGFFLGAGVHALAATWFLRGLRARTEVLSAGLAQLTTEIRSDIGRLDTTMRDMGGKIENALKETASQHLETIRMLTGLEGRISTLERERKYAGGEAQVG